MFGVAQKDGKGRPTEDRVVVRDLTPSCRMFAVVDGHGGATAAEVLIEDLPEKIRSAVEAAGPDWVRSAVPILQDVFIEMDQDLAGPPSQVRGSGAVATVALVTPTSVVVAWVGDAPSLLVDAATHQIFGKTRFHHPTADRPDEIARIRAAGGSVLTDEAGTPRVDGGLMISRAFGDFMYKWNTRTQKPPPVTADWSAMSVTAFPDILVWDRPVGDAVLILSSDGLLEGPGYEALSISSLSERVMTVIQDAKDDTPTRIARRVVTEHVEAAPKPYRGDDLSLIVVKLPGIGRNGAQGGGGLPPIRTFRTSTTRKGRVVRRRRRGGSHA